MILDLDLDKYIISTNVLRRIIRHWWDLGHGDQQRRKQVRRVKTGNEQTCSRTNVHVKLNYFEIIPRMFSRTEIKLFQTDVDEG